MLLSISFSSPKQKKKSSTFAIKYTAPGPVGSTKSILCMYVCMYVCTYISIPMLNNPPPPPLFKHHPLHSYPKPRPPPESSSVHFPSSPFPFPFPFAIDNCQEGGREQRKQNKIKQNANIDPSSRVFKFLFIYDYQFPSRETLPFFHPSIDRGACPFFPTIPYSVR